MNQRRFTPFVSRYLFLVALLISNPARAQLQSSEIRGTVLGPDDGLVRGAAISLLGPLGEILLTTKSDDRGRFVFRGVAPGSYRLRAKTAELQSLLHRVSVHSALPIEIEIRLRARLAEELVVTSATESTSVATRVSLAGEPVRRSSGRIRSRGLQAAVATTPGWATEDNGILHVRGVDDGFLYVQDGLPVYDRLDALFGFPPDPASIGSVHILTGYIPPEYGLKSGGVIEVRSETRLRESWSGTFETGAGSLATQDVSGLVSGPITKAASLTLNFAGERSARFLDPTHPENFHNHGRIFGGGGEFTWRPSSGDSITASTGFGRSTYEVPHGERQQEAGQDQRQELRQSFQSISWQRFWSSRTVSHIAAYLRSSRAKFHGSEDDTPITAQADREQDRSGVLASVTHQKAGHTLKAGIEVSRIGLREFFTFAVTDDEEAEETGLSAKALEFKPGNPFVFRGRVSRPLWSFYLQDSFRPWKNLTLDLGLRFDDTRLLVDARQWSPRLGGSYLWEASRTTVRASFNRFFQPPQAENLLLSSSPEARLLSPFASDSSEGGAELLPERQTAFEIGVEQWLAGSVRLDMAYWKRHVRNYSDPNVFFGSTVVFPNSVARGRAAGLDLRLEVPARRGWSGYASYSNSRVVQFGPINGGLFLEHEIIDIRPGRPFTPDHDQRNVAAVGVTYEHARSGTWFSVTGRHESGTPLQIEEDELEELLERPGAHLVNIDHGRVKPRTVLNCAIGKNLIQGDRVNLSARLEFWNLTNRAYAFNFGNPFSGTHFGSPRTAALKLRMEFR